MYNSVQKGCMRYDNNRYVWKTVMACEDLIEILTRCKDEFPGMKYNEIYMLTQTLIALKYSAIELIGNDGEKDGNSR